MSARIDDYVNAVLASMMHIRVQAQLCYAATISIVPPMATSSGLDTALIAECFDSQARVLACDATEAEDTYVRIESVSKEAAQVKVDEARAWTCDLCEFSFLVVAMCNTGSKDYPRWRG